MVRLLSTIVRFLMSSVFLLSAFAKQQAHLPIQTENPTQANPQKKLERLLAETAHDFVDKLQKGDPQDLLSFFSLRGVRFGADEPPISLATIQSHFEQKKGLFCVFFDTACLQKEDAIYRAHAGAPPRTKAIHSYRDRLLHASQRELIVRVSRVSGNWVGRLEVRLAKDPDAPEPLEFEFEFQRGWKVTGVPFF